MIHFYTNHKRLMSRIALPMVAILASAGLNAQVSTFPWTETFEENSPTRSQWTQIYEVNNMSWTYTSSPSTGGGTGTGPYEGSLMANYPATSHNFDKTKLVSPVMDLSGNASGILTFHFRNPFWSPDQNWLRIFYRMSPTSDWVQLAEFHSHVPAWTSSGEIILPNPTSTYQIAVECETDYGYSTTVDALNVIATPLSAAEFGKFRVSYSPNPADNVVQFAGSEVLREIRIFNLLGQQVKLVAPNADMGNLDVSDLQSGQYIVKATSDLGSNVSQLIKK